MRSFLNLNIYIKLMSAFVLMAILLAVSSSMAISNMSVINDNVDNIYDRQLLRLEMLSDMRALLLRISKASYSMLVARDRAALAKAIEDVRDIDRQLVEKANEYEPSITTPDVRKFFGDFRDAYREYKEAREERQYKPLLEGKKEEVIKNLAVSEFVRAMEALSKMIEAKTKIADQKYQSSQALYQSTRQTMVAISIGAVIFALALGYGISSLIANPLRMTMAVLESVARGDLSKKVNVRATDELGRTGLALNTAIDAMKKSVDANAEAIVNGTAMNQVLESTANAAKPEDIVRTALDIVRSAFGFAYGSYWKVDPKEIVLRCAVEAGSINEEFRRASADARVREGEGLNGRAWRQRDLFVADDPGRLTDCCRTPVAQRAGAKYAVCCPITTRGQVVGTIDFFDLQTDKPSKGRLDALRNVGKFVSAAIERLEHEIDMARTTSMVDQSDANILFADREFVLRYANASSVRTFRTLEKYLPVKADQIVGQSIDLFHKHPEQQRRLLADPSKLPHRARFQLGSETIDLLASAVFDNHRNHLGSMVSWDVVTEQLAMQKSIKDNADREKAAADEIRSRVDAILEVVNAAAHGDLTREAAVQGEGSIDQLAGGLNQLLANLRESMATLAGNATSLGSSSEQLSAVSQQMSGNAQETAAQAGVVSAASSQVSASVQTVATGIEEMGASIKEIAKNASEAARVATDAVRVAETTNATVSKLGESSAEIGQVIKVITSIAQQTNLLALNATIEAARAGEAGKGFAVVANEVKELAKETARATEEIGQKIEAIQTDTKGAVDAIGKIGGIIAKINDISSTIASAVEEQTATTNEIGRNVAEVAKSSADIAQNITSVATTAQSTTEGAGNTHQAAGELSRMAAEMQELVGHFRFEMNAPAAAPVAPSKQAARRSPGGNNKVSAGS